MIFARPSPCLSTLFFSSKLSPELRSPQKRGKILLFVSGIPSLSVLHTWVSTQFNCVVRRDCLLEQIDDPKVVDDV